MEASDSTTPWRARDLLRPTLGDLIAVFLIFMVVVVGGGGLFTDGDPATHVATGLWILEHRQVPHTDPFSTTSNEREWVAHEWLADLGMGLVYRAAGWDGIVAAAALLISAAYLLLYRFLLWRGDDALPAFVAVVAAAATASTHWVARPHLVTILCLVLLTILLEEVTQARRSPIWLIGVPFLLLLWANLHGGFLIAFATLACYGAGIVIEGRARSLLAPLAFASAAAALAVLVNPWGWRLLRYLLAFFVVPGQALRATTEFQTPMVNQRAGPPFFMFLTLVIAALASGAWAWWAGRRRRTATARAFPFAAGALLACGLSTFMCFIAVRHLDVMVIFGVLTMASGYTAVRRHLTGASAAEAFEDLRAREMRCGGGLSILAAAGLLLCAALGRLPGNGYDPARFPVAMVGELRAKGVVPSGPVLSPDDWGGYLILAWPQAKVYIDGRWDLRDDDFLDRYLTIYLALPGWERGLKDGGVNLVLLPPNGPLAAALRGSTEWRVLGSDDVAIVFERRPPAGGG